MNNMILSADNENILAEWLRGDAFVTACLCAAWCDTCAAYEDRFKELAARHPEQYFVWIDIEDQADIVGDLDIDNFPTLLIQQGDVVAFFGTVLPDIRQAERLLRVQMEKSHEELKADAVSTAEKKGWQEHCNLRANLQ